MVDYDLPADIYDAMLCEWRPRHGTVGDLIPTLPGRQPGDSGACPYMCAECYNRTDGVWFVTDLQKVMTYIGELPPPHICLHAFRGPHLDGWDDDDD